MNLTEVLRQVSADLGRSVPGFAPETALVATIVLLLVVRVFQASSKFGSSWLAGLGTLVALVLAITQWTNAQTQLDQAPTDLATVSSSGSQAAAAARPAEPRAGEPIDLFTGMLRFDTFTIFFRLFLLSFAALVIWLTVLTGIPDPEDSPDFYTLLLGATLGMSLMASANHLLMVYIAVEMASLPSYAMAGFLKGRREASEAALKYVVFGAGASGIMLYGISLLVGKYGTAHMPSLGMMIAHGGDSVSGVLLLGMMLVLAGVAFKIAAVPFHFWCPDVFEGAAAEVAGFLSVASKAAALGLLVRFTILLTSSATIAAVESRPAIDIYLGAAIACLAAITATYGNLAAYAQTNLKRLLAFSTIAHAGYMMMPVAAAVSLAGLDTARILAKAQESISSARPALESLVFYLVIYLFMNLGAFAIVALIRNQIGSEDLKDYAGLVHRSPFLTVAMAVFLLSLTGIPPLAGFAAKFRIFAVLYEAKLYWLLAVGLANTVFSLFYYVKVLRVMILDEPVAAAPGWTVSPRVAVFCAVLVVFNLGAMFAWNTMNNVTELAVPDLLNTK